MKAGKWAARRRDWWRQQKSQCVVLAASRCLVHSKGREQKCQHLFADWCEVRNLEIQ